MAKEAVFSKKIELTATLNVDQVYKQLQELSSKLGRTTPSQNMNLFGSIEDQLTKISGKVEKVTQQAKLGFGSTSEIKTFNQDLEQIGATFKNVTNEMSQLQKKNTNIFGTGTTKQIEDFDKRIEAMSGRVKKALDELVKLKAVTSGASQWLYSVFNQADKGAGFQQLEIALANIVDSARRSGNWTPADQNIQNLYNKIAGQDFSSTSISRSYYEALVKDREAAMSRLQQQSQSSERLNADITAQAAAVNNATQQWNAYGQTLQTTANRQAKVENGLTALLRRLEYFLSFTSLFYRLRQEFHKTLNDLTSLDKSFGQIAMVTSYSVQDMWSSYSQYARMANELGQSTNDVVQASVLFYQQGLKTNDVLKLTEDTMRLATLANSDFTQATDLMTAAIRGFNLEMTDGAHITDVYSELAAHAAASVQEIAVAMNKTAALANSAGMSFENTSAFLTQMIESTQETAVNIGTAMKTIIARFTELKENVDDSEEDIEKMDYNKVDKALKSVGVQLKDTNGQFRDLDEVFLELSSKWKTLSRNSQRYIATTAAGSRQQSRFIAMMSNYERTLELVKTAQDSAGRSLEQFEKYGQTIEYTTKQLKNSWEQFRLSLINSKGWNTFLQNVNVLVEKIANLDRMDWTKILATYLLLGQRIVRSIVDGITKTSGSITTALANAVKYDNGKAGSINGSLTRATRGIFTAPSRLINRFSPEAAVAREELQSARDAVRIAQKRSDFYTSRQSSATDYLNRVANERGIPYTEVQRARQELEQAEADARREAENLKTAQQQYKDARQNYTGVLSSNVKGPSEESISKFYAQSLSAAGQTAGAAFIGGFTAAMMTDDPGTVLKSSLISGATAAIPMITSALTAAMTAEGATVGSVLAATGSVAAGVVAAIGVIAGAFYWWKKYKQNQHEQAELNYELQDSSYSLSKAIEKLEEKEKELGEAARETTHEYKAQADEIDSLEKNAKKLKELQDKVLLTDEEQQEYISLSNEIAEIAPELVNGYDLEGNALISLGHTYDEIIEKKEKMLLLDKLEADSDQAEYYANEVVKIQTQIDQVAALSEDVQKLNKVNSNNFMDFLAWTTNGVSTSGKAKSLMQSLGTLATDFKVGQGGANAILKQVLSERTEFSSLRDKDTEKYGAELRKFLNKKNEEERKQLIDIIIDEINNASQADVKKLTGNLEKNLRLQSQYALQKQLDLLQLDESTIYNTTTNENLRTAMGQQLYDLIGLDYDKFKKHWEETNEQGTNETAEAYRTRFAEDFQQAIKNIELTDAEIAQLNQLYTKEVEDAWNKITGKWTNQDNIYTKYMSLSGLVGRQTWAEANIEQFKAYSAQVEELGELIGQETVAGPTINDFGVQTFAQGSLGDKLINMGEEAYSLFYEGLKNASEAGIGAKNVYLDIVRQMVDGVPLDQVGQVFNFAWKEINATNEKAKHEEFLDTFEDKAWAQQVWDTMLSYFVPQNDSITSLEESIDESFEKVRKITEAYGTLMKEYVSKGTLNSEALKNLKKNGAPIEQIFKDGKLDTNLLAQWVEEQVNEGQVALDKAIKNTEAYIAKWKRLQQLWKEHPYIFNSAFLANMGFQQEAADIMSHVKAGDMSTYLDDMIEGLQAAYDAEADARAHAQAEIAMEGQIWESVQKEIADAEEDKADKVEKAQKAVKDAYDDVLEKQQDLIDKQKELEKVMYGDPNHEIKNSGLYNYQTVIESLTDSVERAKDALDDLNGEEPSQYIDQWLRGSRAQKAYLLAENNRYAQATQNTAAALQNQLSSFLRANGYSLNVNDLYSYNNDANRYLINYSALTGARIPDKVKDTIAELVGLMNENQQNIEENQQKIKDLEKSFEDYRKKLRDNYIKIQEEVVKKLEEQYKKAIEDKKAMYEGMKQADSDYISELEKAINKQRQLQERQDQWRVLSEKEKKLSLISRDTSGSTRKDTLKLQKDIEKDRRSMLNTAVDDIVSNLKELYEEQQKTHDLEIQYQEAILDNANLVQEANAIINSWKSMDEMTQWMWEHTEGIEKMSDEAVEKLTEDWADMYDEMAAYNALIAKDITGIMDVSAAEIQEVVATTSETITTEANRVLSEMAQEVEDAIKQAMEAVQKAVESLDDAQKKYNEEVKELNDILEETAEKVQNMEGESEEEQKNPITANARFVSLMGQYESNAGNSAAQSAIWAEIESIIGRHVEAEEARSALYDADMAKYQYKDTNKFQYMGAQLLPQEIPDGWHKVRAYANGGLVNYTGPAWVDGSPSRPESFLSAEDTARIGEAANILAAFAGLGNGHTLASGFGTVVGDTNVELHIHVDSIATEQQVDYLIDRIKEEVVDAANPIGSAVLLHQ